MSLTSLRPTKSSGYKWLGDIPEQWGVKKFRYVFSESQEKIESPNGIKGEMLSVSGYRGIEVKEYEDETLKRKPSELINYRIVKPKQLVVNTMWLNYAGLGVSNHIGYVSPAYRSYAIRQDFNTRFIHHLMRSDMYVKGYTRLLTGIRPNSLQMGRDDLMAFPIVVPPGEEQQKIAQFLDYERAKIDALIDEQKRLIELLKEKRQAVISHAVTKGLNPDAPMKDSGIEWLGEVPEHWLVAQFKYFTTELQTGPFGSQLHSEDYVSGGIPMINPAHIKNGKLIPDKEVSVDQKTQLRLLRHCLQSEDMIFARRGELGRCAVVRSDNEGWLCGTGSLKAVLNSKLIPDYAYLLFSSDEVADELGLESKGSTMPNLNTETLGRCRLPIPPVNEQKAIITRVKLISGSFEQLIAEGKQTESLLKERRSALISAAVTGKIDVRDWQPPAGSDTVDSNASMLTERHYG